MNRSGRSTGLVGLVLALLLSGLLWPDISRGATPADVPAHHAPSVARICPAGEDCFSYARPRVMKKRFKADRYGNAAGTRMPRWVFRKAKRYVVNHPGVAPDSARPVYDVNGRLTRGWDWGWLEWTKDRLNTARCLSLGPSPVTWFGCDGQPEWVDTVRSVKVKCGGTALIIAAVTRNPIAVGSGAGVCVWGEIQELAD